jgi:hypothetical protein
MTMAEAHSHCGKQVLVDGQHFADARSPVAAAVIVEALNRLGGKIVGTRLREEASNGELKRKSEPREAMLQAATRMCEAFTGQWLLARGGAEEIRIPWMWQWQRLRATPVRAILRVDGLSSDNVPSALPAERYTVDIDSCGDGWVRIIEPGAALRARVRFVAGMSEEWAALPKPLLLGIGLLAGHLESHPDDACENGPPARVAALWRPWRRLRLEPAPGAERSPPGDVSHG